MSFKNYLKDSVIHMYNSPYLGIVYILHYVVQLLNFEFVAPPFPLALELF